MDIPSVLLPHTVTVRPLTGNGPYGAVFATPVTVPCRLRFVRRMVRNTEGAEVISEATITTTPDQGPILAVGSQVSDATGLLLGRILTSSAADDGGLGAWQHHTAAL